MKLSADELYALLTTSETTRRVAAETLARLMSEETAVSSVSTPSDECFE